MVACAIFTIRFLDISDETSLNTESIQYIYAISSIISKGFADFTLLCAALGMTYDNSHDGNFRNPSAIAEHVRCSHVTLKF